MDTKLDTSPMTAAQNMPAEAKADMPAKEPGFIQRNSLRIGGILDLVGDVGLLRGGLKIGDPYKTAGGVFYTIGGLNLSLFGRVKTEEKDKQITQDTAEFVKKEIGSLPSGTALAKAEADRVKNRTKGFLYNNAAQNTLYAYTAGAAAMLGSGIKKHRDGEGSAALMYGTSSMAFKLISLLVSEKSSKEDTDDKKKGGIVEWVREKPLRVFGYGSFLTDSFLGVAAYQDYKRDPKGSDYRLTALSTANYLVADILFANSNKNPANAAGKLSALQQQQLEENVAETINQQPGAQRGKLLAHVSEFLAKRPEVHGSAQEMATGIQKRMQQIGQGDWATRVGNTETKAEQLVQSR